MRYHRALQAGEGHVPRDEQDAQGFNDRLSSDNAELSEILWSRVADYRREAEAPARGAEEQTIRAEADHALSMRKGLIEAERSDPNGYERLLGRSNLLAINFLDRGRRSADAVCRIKLPMEGGHSCGTAFLVGPRLLLTNNHVLSNRTEASQAVAEFGFENDLDGVLKEPVRFNLDPNSLFFTSPELDFTLLAVAPLSEASVPLDRFGWLPLIPLQGKTLDGEDVSIIQHPGGQPKQIAIHASRIIKLPEEVSAALNVDQFIHYSTDTEPGSSGAPVFNDQWQVVALHHKAVPAPQQAVAPDDPKFRWIANEGVRISAIFKHLELQRFEDENAGRALDLMGRGLGFGALAVRQTPERAMGEVERYAPYKKTRWTAKELGYDQGFLSEPLPLAPIYAPLLGRGDVAPLLDGSGHELRYWHFSSVLHARRKFPILTVVNIDGRRLEHPGERKDTWRQDARIAGEYQPEDAFYVKSRAEEKVYFSRGHMVRLLDPCWSDSEDPAQRKADARRGMEDTFHFTNAAPQVQTYNDRDWGNLEDYILDKAQTSERRLTVFTGPIFRDNDPLYGREREGGPWQIPLSFWKIAVLQKTDTRVAAAAFIIGQTEYVRALYEAKIFSGLKPYTIDELRSRKVQTSIATVEQETGLDFGALRPFDSQGSLEATRRTQWFNQLEDIHI
jgi:endonuclease G